MNTTQRVGHLVTPLQLLWRRVHWTARWPLVRFTTTVHKNNADRPPTVRFYERQQQLERSYFLLEAHRLMPDPTGHQNPPVSTLDKNDRPCGQGCCSSPSSISCCADVSRVDEVFAGVKLFTCLLHVRVLVFVLLVTVQTTTLICISGGLLARS